MQQMVGHNVARDKNDSTAMWNQKTKKDQSPSKPKAKRRRFQRKPEVDEYPDTFIPLSHQQPPILETMKMGKGVSLEHKGKSKSGPERQHIEGHYTRKEYLAQARREISGDTQLQFTQSGGVKAVGGNSGNSPVESTSSPSGRKEDSPRKGEDSSASKQPTRSDSLPALDKGRPPPQEVGSSPAKAAGGLKLAGSGAGVSPGDAAELAGGKDRDKIQTSPLAPPMHTRARKFDSIGHLTGRPPRVHPPLLGKLNVHVPDKVQPPLGATMGHGLMRHENSVEEFYFPPFIPEAPGSLGRRTPPAHRGRRYS